MRTPIEIARQLTPALNRLGALLAPLSDGFRTSDGRNPSPADLEALRRPFLQVVIDAEQALLVAHQQLTQQPQPTGNPS